MNDAHFRPTPRSCLQALQVLLEKFPFHELRDALVRAGLEESFFHALPVASVQHGLAHAQVVHGVIEGLARRGVLVPGEPTVVRLLQSLLELRPGLFRELAALGSHHLDVALAPIDPDTDEATLVRLRPGQLEGHERGRLVDELEQLTVRRSNLPESAHESEALRLKISAIARELHATGGATRGQRVAGTILEDVIASGSFGTVWRARSATTGRPLATKVFHLDKLSQGLMMARFRRSIQTIKLLTSDPRCPRSILCIHDASVDLLAFSMDYARCGTFESLRKFQWPLAVVIAKFRAICEACHFAHEKGVIHRDIKPNNILLSDDLEPILIDFDISDATTSRIDYLGASTQGWLGTPVFGAPEQLTDARSATRQSDVFGLGRLLHYMLLDGQSPGMLTEHEPNLEDLSDRPSALVEIVRKATRYDPRRRHASVKDMIDELDRHHTGLAAVRVWLLRSGRWLRRHRSPVAVLVAGLALVLGLWRLRDAMERQQLVQTADRDLQKCRQQVVEGQQRALIAAALRRPAPALTPAPALAEPASTPPPAGRNEPSPAQRPLPRPAARPPVAARVETVAAPAPPPDSPPAGKGIPPDLLRRITTECADLAWPMVSFTISVRVDGGPLTPKRSASDNPHPAIDCASKVIAAHEPRITATDGSTAYHWPIALEHSDAPDLYIARYRDMERHLASSRRSERQGRDQTTLDATRLYFGKSQAHAVAAAKIAEEIGRGVLARTRSMPDWPLHYAVVARLAIDLFERADRNKRLQWASSPGSTDRASNCSRDLDDAWRLAVDASERLAAHAKLRSFFVEKAEEHASYRNFEERCTVTSR